MEPRSLIPRRRRKDKGTYQFILEREKSIELIRRTDRIRLVNVRDPIPTIARSANSNSLHNRWNSNSLHNHWNSNSLHNRWNSNSLYNRWNSNSLYNRWNSKSLRNRWNSKYPRYRWNLEKSVRLMMCSIRKNTSRRKSLGKTPNSLFRNIKRQTLLMKPSKSYSCEIY